MGREEVDKLLIIFDNVEMSEIEYTSYSELYDFTNETPQNLFNIALNIIKHRLKRNTQTPYDRDNIKLYANKNGLTLPFDLDSFNSSSTEILFGLVSQNGR